MPWTCKGCEEPIEDSFDECWSCGTNRDGSPPENEELFIETDPGGPAGGEPLDVSAMSLGGDADFAAQESPDLPRTMSSSDRPAANASRKGVAHRRASASAATRYADGYSVAGAITGWAAVVKFIGVVAAILVFIALTAFIGAVGGEAGATAAIVAFFGGSLVWALFYGLGVIVAAQGQILKASLDTAVHSSPFLTDQQRVEAMSL